MENIYMRLEKYNDYRIVEELTRAAFNNPDRIDRSKIGCPMEHYMVHMLRKKDGIMKLSFVAEFNGQIAGHIIYSDAYILKPDEKKVHVLNFGPLSVLPALQRKGIGSALMEYSIRCAKDMSYGAIMFYGHADYYPRFGFVKANEFLGGDINPYCMAMELKENYLTDVRGGKFIEAAIYNDEINREQAKDFDKSFR